MSVETTSQTGPQIKRRGFFQRRWVQIFLGIIVALLLWIAADLWLPHSANLREFDAATMARMETDMWRAYYDKKSFRLYWRLVQTLRHSGLPFWQANLNAYRAARAAMVFKSGRERADYERALPYLADYFHALAKIGHLPADTNKVAQLELEWWIVHRQRDLYGKDKLIDAIAAAAAEFYGSSAEQLHYYARARAAAMIRRDEQAAAGGVSEEEWQQIEAELLRSYNALHGVLNH